MQKIREAFDLLETAESQGHDGVQEALRIRSALASGTFQWSSDGAAMLKEHAVDGSDELLCAKTLRLDDCHSPQDCKKKQKKSIFFEVLRSVFFLLLRI